jgi:hypothetical protein
MLQQNPVEIHQLSYQKQFDYEKALGNKSYLPKDINNNENAFTIVKNNTINNNNNNSSNNNNNNSIYKTTESNKTSPLIGNNGLCYLNEQLATNSLSTKENKNNQLQQASTSSIEIGIDDNNYFVENVSNKNIKTIDFTHIM